MNRKLTTAIIGTLIATVSACGGGSDGVQWDDYSPTLQSNIDALAAGKACDALQDQFDVADANNAATMTRTGHNNAKLMSYIDGKLHDAGCST